MEIDLDALRPYMVDVTIEAGGQTLYATPAPGT
jgi:hypothetical protein